jgi:hypothetical protein
LEAEYLLIRIKRVVGKITKKMAEKETLDLRRRQYSVGSELWKQHKNVGLLGGSAAPVGPAITLCPFSFAAQAILPLYMRYDWNNRGKPAKNRLRSKRFRDKVDKYHETVDPTVEEGSDRDPGSWCHVSGRWQKKEYVKAASRPKFLRHSRA